MNEPCTINYEPTCNPDGGECPACTATSCTGELSLCGPKGCAQCLSNADCSGGKPYCVDRWCQACRPGGDDCATGSCNGGQCVKTCSADHHCSGSTPFCINSHCGTCKTGSDCPEGKACFDGDCRQPLPYDTCEDAYPLTVGPQHLRVKGKVRISDWGNGKPNSSADVFYKIQIDAPVGLNGSLQFADSLVSGRVAVLAGDCRRLVQHAITEYVFSDVYLVPGTYWIRVDPSLPEGTYVLQVSDPTNANRSGGSFNLTATLGPPIPRPPNDTCAAATALTLDAGQFAITGTTRGAANDGEYCVGSDGETNPDVTYLVSFTYPGRVVATVTPLTSGFRPSVGVGTDCYMSGRFCSPAGDAGQPSTANAASAYAAGGTGTVLWVAGHGGITGDFLLSGTVYPSPSNERCNGATAIGVGTHQGDLRGASYNGNSCPIPTTGPDVYYADTATANGTATLRLTPTGFDGLLSVLTGCGSTCVTSAGAGSLGQVKTLTFSVSRNTTYYVMVSAADSLGGPFTLEVATP
ncbi:MAG: hypothetical protein M3Y59_00620 [Myxococcota bacterium]|nr:hypothetical protein [Myxococcota bacterium]